MITPSGGAHLYYRAPEGAELRNTCGRLGWRIDTRAHGGYVLAAGSRLSGPAGARYEVLRDQAPAPLRCLTETAREALLPYLRGADDLVLGPEFSGSTDLAADADVIADGLLLELKTNLGGRLTGGRRSLLLDHEMLDQLLA